MVHTYGHVYIKSVNLSHNKASYNSALYCGPNKIHEETNHGSDVLYCSFSNNTATTQYCVIVGSTAEIKNCNIILNDAKNTIYGSGQTDVISCCVMNNTKRPVFSGSITLYNCSVSSDQFEESNVNTNSLGTTTFIHGLTFLETGSCYASFDVIDSLIPTQIPGTKNCVINTCDDYLIALRQHVFLMLKCIFIICFVPTC